MKLRPYVEKLESSPQFKEFKMKYPDAYMAAGFFVLDFEAGHNIHQLDFYLPKEKKIAAFTLGENLEMQILNLLNDLVPEKLDIETNIDLDALQGILLDEMHNRGMSEQIRKIIAVLQSLEGKRIWNLNCVLTGMEILKSHVEDESKTVLKIEKKSLLDIMQQIPVQKFMKKPEGKEDVDKQLKELDKLQQEIDKERERLKSGLKS